MSDEFIIEKVLRMRVGYVRCPNCGWADPNRSYIETCPSCGAAHRIDVIDEEKLMRDKQCTPYISVEKTENGQVLIARMTHE